MTHNQEDNLINMLIAYIRKSIFMTMTIKFFSNYEYSENLLKRFMANYQVYDNDLLFTTSSRYDFAVIFNGSNEDILPSAKIITVVQEPSWSGLLNNRVFLSGSDYLIVHDRKLIERTHQISLNGTVIESPSYMFYHDNVDHSFYENPHFSVKSKKISMIVSGLNFGIGNYAKRIGLLRKILDSDIDIDIYGKGFNITDSRFKGSLDYKYRGLIPYEYSIAIENSNEKNYITEKFVDCVLCNTVPIYNGAPNIKDVYNDQYFRLLDLDSPTVVEDIKRIIASPAPISSVNKQIYFQDYNLYTMLKNIVFS